MAGDVAAARAAALRELADLLGLSDPQAIEAVLPQPVRFGRSVGHPPPTDGHWGAPPDPFPWARWWATAGDPVRVLITADDLHVVVAEPHIVWEEHTPVLRANATEVCPRGQEGLASFMRAVGAVEARREATFTICAECHRATPPEWVHDGAICQGCAELNHGVVF